MIEEDRGDPPDEDWDPEREERRERKRRRRLLEELRDAIERRIRDHREESP
jgi:transposase